nr:putative nuclease HARBI1 isoform X1 [Crassostrea gigas]
MAAIVVGAIGLHIINDALESDEEDDDLEDIFAISGASLIVRDDRIKSQRYYETTIRNYLPDSFKRFFKVNRETLELLCENLALHPTLSTRIVSSGRPQILLEKKILMTLRYLASQETICELSDRFGVSEHCFLKSKKQVIMAVIDTFFNKCIKWPDVADFPNIAREVDEMGAYNFPGVIGAIDGFHIPIEAPLQNASSYYNRKKFHSIILQGVCKNDLLFTDINVGWPGRVHDAKVLRNSNLWEAGFEKCAHGRYHILGDAAYPLKQWLLTPHRDNGHLNQQQRRYNLQLSSKRQVIERAFALLKGRFRRLKYLNIKKEMDMCQTVVCTCILHNICILQNDRLDDIINVDSDDEDGQGHVNVYPWLQNDAQGTLKRIQITNRM